jgi:hypothetical protein
MRTILKWAVIFVAALALVTVFGHPSGAQEMTHGFNQGLNHGLNHAPWHLLLPPLIGLETTGLAASGDFGGMGNMLKEVYGESFENNMEKDMEVLDLLKRAQGFEVVEGPDGKGINLSHFFSSGGGVGAMLEDDYLYESTVPTNATSKVTIKQFSATQELSGRTLRRVKKGPAAFLTWASEALPRKAARLAYQKDRMALGTGSGILFRINEGTPDGTNDGVDSAFGIAGLEGALNLILRDDNTRWGPNANGTSLRSGTAKFVTGDYDAQTATWSALPTSGANNDYVFLGDDNVNSSGARELMGLEGILDDGTLVPTFQTLTRATYPELNAQIIDATDNGFEGVLSEELLDYADAQCYERGNMGRPDVIIVNRSGQRSFWKTLKSDRVLNDPKGSFTGGKARLRMMLGDRIVTVSAARKCPLSRCYGPDTRSIKRFKIGTGKWDDTDGSVWNRSVNGTGRRDAFYAVWIDEEEVGAGNPAQGFKITNLAAA